MYYGHAEEDIEGAAEVNKIWTDSMHLWTKCTLANLRDATVQCDQSRKRIARLVLLVPSLAQKSLDCKTVNIRHSHSDSQSHHIICNGTTTVMKSTIFLLRYHWKLAFVLKITPCIRINPLTSCSGHKFQGDSTQDLFKRYKIIQIFV